MDLDFTNLPLLGVISTLILFAALDTIAAYAVALINGNFTAAYALDFLRTHVLKVAVPIVLLAIVGHGLPELQIPAIPAAGLMATASLAVYAVATIASIRDSFSDSAVPPTPSTGVAPVTEG